ncbi:MAG: C1 family peptidase [bacterium]
MAKTPPMLTPRPIRRFGWRPDTPDNRDKVFSHLAAMRRMKQKLPSVVDLRLSGFLPPVYDQGELGSCTANAIGAAYEYQQRKQGLENYMPSRLFIYYGERQIEGTINSDAGAEIRDGMKVVGKLGAPHEDLWPYDIGKFARKPSPATYKDAAKHNCLAYESVDVSVPAVKAALAAGHPVVIGFTVYESFDTITKDGRMPIPKPMEKVEGGHAVLVVGYKKMKIKGTSTMADHAIVRNSWGADWAAKGYYYMPLKWLCNTDNADDFWTLNITEG